MPDEIRVASPSRRRRRAALGAVALVLAVGGGWWATHPDRLPPVGNLIGNDRVPVGKPMLVGMFAYPRSGSVTLLEAAPRVREGSAAADVRVVWCVGPRAGSPLGTALEPAEAACAETPPLAGQRLTAPTPATRLAHLVVEVVPREPGRVMVDGLDITYRTGLQRGTQPAGVVVELNAQPAFSTASAQLLRP